MKIMMVRQLILLGLLLMPFSPVRGIDSVAVGKTVCGLTVMVSLGILALQQIELAQTRKEMLEVKKQENDKITEIKKDHELLKKEHELLKKDVEFLKSKLNKNEEELPNQIVVKNSFQLSSWVTAFGLPL